MRINGVNLWSIEFHVNIIHKGVATLGKNSSCQNIVFIIIRNWFPIDAYFRNNVIIVWKTTDVSYYQRALWLEYNERRSKLHSDH